jgi:flagellar basal body P-ring protein FlgI
MFLVGLSVTRTNRSEIAHSHQPTPPAKLTTMTAANPQQPQQPQHSKVIVINAKTGQVVPSRVVRIKQTKGTQ